MKDNIIFYNFCLGRVSKDFTKDEQNEMPLNGTVHNFSVDHISIKKEDILNIHQYLMIKYNIKLYKIMFGLIENNVYWIINWPS